MEMAPRHKWVIPVYNAFPFAACPFKRNVLRRLRLSFAPQFQLVEIFWRYLTIRDPIEEMLAENRWKIGPPNFRHQAPNVIRASSSFSCCRSAEFLD
jgi:hypothetical protein